MVLTSAPIVVVSSASSSPSPPGMKKIMTNSYFYGSLHWSARPTVSLYDRITRPLLRSPSVNTLDDALAVFKGTLGIYDQ